MRGPGGVAYAQVGMEALAAGGRLHFGDAAGTAHATDVEPLPLVDHGDAGRVVAAVFEALETFDEDGNHSAIRDRADDAAHGWGTPEQEEHTSELAATMRQSSAVLWMKKNTNFTYNNE